MLFTFTAIGIHILLSMERNSTWVHLVFIQTDSIVDPVFSNEAARPIGPSIPLDLRFPPLARGRDIDRIDFTYLL